MARYRNTTGVLFLAALLGACTGSIGEPGAGEEETHGPGKAAAPRSGHPEDGPIVDTEGVDPGTKSIHRLNRVEYNASVQDVLGTALAPATELWRGGESFGFDNIADFLGIDELQYQRYFAAAAVIAADALGTSATRDRVVTCEASDDPACVRSIIGATGRRIFRRPIDSGEIGTYQKVYERARALGEGHDASLEQVVRALLASAEFIYRIEADPEPTSATPHAVAPYELASRLSYFLWSSAPDDALLAAAEDATILDDSTLVATARRMLDDPKSERFVESFVGQWLGARRVKTHAVTADLFPDWSSALADAMAGEMVSYFDEFLRADRSYLEFLKADLHFVDDRLAGIYGIDGPGSGTARVEGIDAERFGFLGLGGFLALSSYEYRTAPTLRGRWILINLLCSPPKDPPPGIPTLDPAPGSASASEQNVRARLEAHREDPVCASCHNVLDPYGLALESFDAIGRYRSTYPNGSPIDVSTELVDGTPFEGLEGLSNVVTEHPKFAQCIAEKLFVYGLGRGKAGPDRPYLAQAVARWREETPTLGRLIETLILSEPFRFRRGEAD
jgi:hypothetical protein